MRRDWTLDPSATCTLLRSHTGEADSRVCGDPAIRATEMSCDCFHVFTVLECGDHAENTERLAAGRPAVPNFCGTCLSAGHQCPLDAKPA